MSKLSQTEIADVLLRLSTETLYPVDTLATEAGASPETMIRWIVRGQAGKHLDGVCNGGVWLTSREAVQRFKAATGA